MFVTNKRIVAAVTMEPLTAASVTTSSDVIGVTAAPDAEPSYTPVSQELPASLLHSTSRLSDRRWSVPDECDTVSDSVEAVQQCCLSADVSSKRLSDWETVESGVGSLQPAAHLVYSGVHSHTSHQHSVLPVFSSFCLCIQRSCHM